MKRRSPFVVRLSYLAVIAVLLVPLAWLSQPSTVDTAGRRTSGGLLARLRDEHELSQANLGDIDPTSEAIKLSTLGMRNVAANILWSRAHHDMKTKDWTSLSATLEQITHLQPNFVEVWRFQAWNLSYNVSHEWDDYRDRYYWVIKGINFLRDGVQYNSREPRLAWDVGWFISQKIGRSDERIQFRRMFREDDDFHGGRAISERDNWLLGKNWVLRAEKLVEEGERLIGRNPLVFYAYPPLCQISYAGALEEDGIFDEVAQEAWRRAEEELLDYGNRPLMMTGGRTIQLDGLKRQQERVRGVIEELDALAPGLRDKIRDEKRQQLPPEERTAFDMPPSERTNTQHGLARAALVKLIVSHQDVADRITEPPQQRETARKLVEQAKVEEDLLVGILHSRQVVNYDGWKIRCAAEKTDDALQGRKLIYEADRALIEEADLVTARELYEKAFRHWRDVLDAFPSLLHDGQIGDDLVRASDRFEGLLKQLDEAFPSDFILQDVLDKHKVTPPPL